MTKLRLTKDQVKRLHEGHTKNHELLEKSLLGIPSVALAFVGVFFTTNHLNPTSKYMLAFAFVSFCLAIITMLCSYMTMNADIVDFLEKHEESMATHNDYTSLCNTIKIIRLMNLIGYTFIIAGIAFMFLSAVNL